MTRRAGLCGVSLALSLVAGASCNSIDTGPTVECVSDADCLIGTLCSVEQGNICVPEGLPPRAALAFDIEEDNVRVELQGCDPEVTRELGGSELRVQRRGQIIEDYAFRPERVRAVEDCSTADCTGTCDDEALTCTEPLDLSLDLGSDSRLALSRLTQPSQSYLTTPDPPLPEGELPSPLEFRWASYDSTEVTEHPVIRIDGGPLAESDNALFRRALPEGTTFLDEEGEPTDIVVADELRCQRGLISSDGVRTVLGQPVAGAEVEFTYDEVVAADSTVLGGPGSACDADEDCSPGWACGEQGRCGLDLSGLSAGSTDTLEDGSFGPAWMYTYCEGVESAGDDILVRELQVRVNPADESGLPTTLYSLAQEFPDPATPGASRLHPMTGKLCLPDWAGPEPVEFALEGEPVELLETSLGKYTCCSTECLPSNDPDVEPAPPPMVSSCSGFDRVRFETRWINDVDPEVWEAGECMPSAAFSDGSNGRYVRDVNTCEEGQPCVVALTIGDELEPEARTYVYSITQPVGSVFRSITGSFEFTAGMDALPTFELLPRVLLRGRIACAAGTQNCSAEGALFAAERLRVAEEDDPPGPYFFQASVDAQGNFVLPIDPGIYVVTAYPAVGQPGGPAPFDVLDLREDSPLLTNVEGVPNVSLAAPFELDDGRLVRAFLRDFDLSTTIRPIDTGSWQSQGDAFPYDLNDPQTCYGPARRGCQIRSLLRPTQAPLSLSITRRLQFTTRTAGSDNCP